MSKCVTTINGLVNGPKDISAYDTQSPTNIVAYDTQSPTNLTALSSPVSGPELLTYKITMTDFPTFADLNNAYYFNSRTSSLAGPFNSDITTITSRDNTAELYGINSDKDIVKTDMLDLNNTNFSKVDHVINVEESFSENINIRAIPTPCGIMRPTNWNMFKANWENFDKIESFDGHKKIQPTVIFLISGL